MIRIQVWVRVCQVDVCVCVPLCPQMTAAVAFVSQWTWQLARQCFQVLRWTSTQLNAWLGFLKTDNACELIILNQPEHRSLVWQVIVASIYHFPTAYH